MAESEAAGIKSSEDIREDLECPVCFKIPRTTPIYQCEQGHIHCKKCHPRLRDCPICRGSIGNTRNLVAEKIISKLPVRCTNFEKGCEEPQALPDQITEHEKYCEFRMVKCFYTRCADLFAFNNPMKHLKKHLPLYMKSGTSLSFKARLYADIRVHDEYLMHFEDNRKFGVSHVTDDTGCQVIRVFFIGSPIMAKKFSSIITFSSTEADNDFKITFKRTISAYQDSLSDIAPCSRVHPKSLQEIVSKVNTYRIEISIISKSDDEPKCKKQRLENKSTSTENQCRGAENIRVDRVDHNETILIESDDE